MTCFDHSSKWQIQACSDLACETNVLYEEKLLPKHWMV